MLDALDYVTATILARMFKMAEGFVFACGTCASLDIDLKENTVGRRAFQFDDFPRSGGDSLEAADCDPFFAALGHFQMPHAANDSEKRKGRKERNLPVLRHGTAVDVVVV